MPITILPPAAAAPVYARSDSDDENDAFDSDGDVDMEGASRASKRARVSRKNIVTPGETVTDDSQWMRYVHLTALHLTSYLWQPLTALPQRPWHLRS